MKRLLVLRTPLSRYLTRIQTAKLGMAAASVAFFGFLALFPGTAVVIALWGVGADPAFVGAQIEPLRDILPADAYALFAEQVKALVAASTPGLGWTTFFSILLALWSARAGTSALVSGLNAVYHLPERGGVGHELLSIILTVALVAITLAALVLAVIVPVGLAHLPLGSWSAFVLQIANILLGVALAGIGLAVTYRFGPNRARGGKHPFLTPGLIVALILWLLASRGFALYLGNFGSYNKVYGSIGAVAALMMWFYVSAYAILLGAAVDAELNATPRTQAT